MNLERHSQEEMVAANTEYLECNNKANHVTKKPPVTFFIFFLKYKGHFFVFEFIAEIRNPALINLIKRKVVIPY